MFKLIGPVLIRQDPIEVRLFTGTAMGLSNSASTCDAALMNAIQDTLPPDGRGKDFKGIQHVEGSAQQPGGGQ